MDLAAIEDFVERARCFYDGLANRDRVVQASTAELYREMFDRLIRHGRTPDYYTNAETHFAYRASVTFTAKENLASAFGLYDQAMRDADTDTLARSLLLMRESMDWLERYPPKIPEKVIREISGNQWQGIPKEQRRRYTAPHGMRQKILESGTIENGLIWEEAQQSVTRLTGLAVLLTTGARSVEIERGVKLQLKDLDGEEVLVLTINTAKTNRGRFGQPTRSMTVAIDRPWIGHLATLARNAGGEWVVNVKSGRSLSNMLWEIGERLKRDGKIPKHAKLAAYHKRNELSAELSEIDPLVAELALGHKLKKAR